MRAILLLLLLLAPVWAEPELEPTAAGRELARRLQEMDVERHWLPGRERVDWQTGDGTGQLAKKRKTWCSSFVAAACQRLGIYILRPPEHEQTYLSNAQQEWLLGPGREQGWERLADGREAQMLANQGHLVVASWRAPEARKAGHIAIVLPGPRTFEQLEKDGPLMINVGSRNYTSTTLRKAFAAHPGAWERKEILFFSHALP